MKTVVITIAAAISLAILLGTSIVYSGLFNVATAWEDPALIRWALVKTRENSIKRHASSIEAPEKEGEKQLQEGFRSYREMCAICHTPPGAKASPVAKGLNPAAPDLAKSAKNLSAAELFWVIKNGIRMTGMPAWGVTHKDGEMWDTVAFVQTLPDMSGETYREMDSRIPKGHSHAGGGHDGEGGHDDMENSHADISDEGHDNSLEKKEHKDDGHSH